MGDGTMRKLWLRVWNHWTFLPVASAMLLVLFILAETNVIKR